MDKPTSRDAELAKIMSDFEGSPVHKAMWEIIEKLEFNTMQNVLSADVKELPLLQEKLKAYRELMFFFKFPQMKLEAYAKFLEQRRMEEESYGGF
jgi:hypothetical protein